MKEWGINPFSTFPTMLAQQFDSIGQHVLGIQGAVEQSWKSVQNLERTIPAYLSLERPVQDK